MSNYNDIETMMEALIERTKIIVNEAYMHHREFHAKTPRYYSTGLCDINRIDVIDKLRRHY